MTSLDVDFGFSSFAPGKCQPGFFFLNDMFLVPATQISLCVGSGMLSTVGNVVLQSLAARTTSAWELQS